MANWNLEKLSTASYNTSSYDIAEAYNNISITADTADITLELSRQGKTAVTCFEQTNMTHSVAVEDGTLVIRANDTRKWYEHFGIFLKKPQITLSLPQGKYDSLVICSNTGDITIPEHFAFGAMNLTAHTGDVWNQASVSGELTIKTTTGNIHMKNLSAGTIALSVTTGNISASSIICGSDFTLIATTGDTVLDHVQCKSLTVNGKTGKLSLINVIAEDTFNATRSTGDVSFSECDAG